MDAEQRLNRYGLVYQCLWCLSRTGKVYKGLKKRVEDHILKQHLSLDEVPYYCKLCLFRTTNKLHLDKHVTTYARHVNLARGRGITDHTECLVANPCPYQFGERDHIKYSKEESLKFFRERMNGSGTPSIDPLSEACNILFQEHDLEIEDPFIPASEGPSHQVQDTSQGQQLLTLTPQQVQQLLGMMGNSTTQVTLPLLGSSSLPPVISTTQDSKGVIPAQMKQVSNQKSISASSTVCNQMSHKRAVAATGVPVSSLPAPLSELSDGFLSRTQHAISPLCVTVSQSPAQRSAFVPVQVTTPVFQDRLNTPTVSSTPVLATTPVATGQRPVHPVAQRPQDRIVRRTKSTPVEYLASLAQTGKLTASPQASAAEDLMPQLLPLEDQTIDMPAPSDGKRKGDPIVHGSPKKSRPSSMQSSASSSISSEGPAISFTELQDNLVKAITSAVDTAVKEMRVEFDKASRTIRQAEKAMTQQTDAILELKSAMKDLTSVLRAREREEERQREREHRKEERAREERRQDRKKDGHRQEGKENSSPRVKSILGKKVENKKGGRR